MSGDHSSKPMKSWPSSIPPVWRAALPGFLLALAGVLWLFRDTGLAMVEIWNRSETFAHAFVVPPLSLWLIWRQRAALAALRPAPAPWFLLLLALACVLWLLGELVAVNAATQFAFVALLVLVVPATLGWPVARSIAFPLGFLFFAVPFGEFAMPQLMAWTADFTVAALRLSNIPVYREGLQFVIPSGNWSVVEACSGIRYLMASVMVGTLFAYLNYRSLRRRWIFAGVAIVLPLAANWVRAYLIVLLGHLSGNKLAAGADHLIYGWVFFGVVMLAMFMIGAKWSEPDAAPLAAADPVLAATPTAGGVAWRWATPLLALILLALPHGLVHTLTAKGDGKAPSLAATDLSAMGWRLEAAQPARFKPVFENPRAELQASYAKGDAAVGLYIAYYRQQRYDSKLISSNHVLVRSKDKDWAQVSSGQVHQPLPARTAELRGQHVEPGSAGATEGSRLRVWQFYWINGRVLHSDWQAKLYGALYRLAGRGDDGAVVVLYADKAAAGPEDALLAAFLRDNWARLDAGLHASRDAAAQADAKHEAAEP